VPLRAPKGMFSQQFLTPIYVSARYADDFRRSLGTWAGTGWRNHHLGIERCRLSVHQHETVSLEHSAVLKLQVLHLAASIANPWSEVSHAFGTELAVERDCEHTCTSPCDRKRRQRMAQRGFAANNSPSRA
jgi:hypothetical protein